MSPVGRRAAAAAGLLLAAVAAAGCVTGTRVTTPPGTALATSVTTSPPVATAPATPAATASAASPALPPVASLAVEGGDPVPGELGAYAWGGSGSDGPWLAGTPVTLGAGEPVSVAIAGDPHVTTWRARIAADSEGASPHALASGGAGTIRFPAPAAGSWTVELTVDVAGGDSATWYWELDAS